VLCGREDRSSSIRGCTHVCEAACPHVRHRRGPAAVEKSWGKGMNTSLLAFPVGSVTHRSRVRTCPETHALVSTPPKEQYPRTMPKLKPLDTMQRAADSDTGCDTSTPRVAAAKAGSSAARARLNRVILQWNGEKRKDSMIWKIACCA